MAILALGAGAASVGIGSAVGAAAFTGAAAALGSYLDSRFLFPQLFGGKDPRGPMLGGLEVGPVEEGAPLHAVVGRRGKVTGTPIWTTSPTVTTSGSTGGKDGVPASYDVTVDCAILMCEGTLNADQPVTRVFANGKRIYVTGEPLVFQATPADTIKLTGRNYGGSPYPNDFSLAIDIPTSLGDATDLAPGQLVTITNSINFNGDWRVSFTQPVGTNGPTISSASLKPDDPATVVFTGPAFDSPTVTITQDPEAASLAIADAVRVYTGEELFNPGGTNTAQDPDPAIVAVEDPDAKGLVPHYRRSAYMVFEGLKLNNFGNRLPTFSFIVQRNVNSNVPSAIQEVLTRGGLDVGSFSAGAEFDTTLLAQTEHRGQVIRGPQRLIETLQPTAIYGDVLAQERSGVIWFFNRDDAVTVEVPETDLAARGPRQQPNGRPIRMTDVSELDPPSEVTVRFRDDDADHTIATKRERRSTGRYDKISSVDLSPMAMTVTQGRDVAARTLWAAQANRQRVQMTLPPTYLEVSENDLVNFTVWGRNWSVLVQTVTIGPAYRLEIEGFVEESYALPGLEVGAEGAESGGVLTQPVTVRFGVLDIAPLQNSHTGIPILWVGASPYNGSSPFPGATVFLSIDGGTEWTEIATLAQPISQGQAVDALAAGTAGIWDYANTVEVEMVYGTLASATEAQVLGGANLAMLGNEIIGFQTATLNAGGSYTLSGLLRGRRDTVTSGHAAGDPFVMIDATARSGALKAVEMDTADLVGTTLELKAITPGQSLDDVASFGLTYAANSMRTFAPTGLAVERNGNEPTVTWTPRTRKLVDLFGVGANDLAEPVERYIVRAWSTAGSELDAVEYEVASTQAFTYSEEDQTTDGLTPGNSVTFTVAQIGTVGRSRDSDEVAG